MGLIYAGNDSVGVYKMLDTPKEVRDFFLFVVVHFLWGEKKKKKTASTTHVASNCVVCGVSSFSLPFYFPS